MIALNSVFRFVLLTSIVTHPCTPLRAAQTTKTNPPLTVEEVLKLVQSGFSEELIITKIRKNAKAFDLNTDELVELKRLGVSDNIVKYLLDPSLPYTPPAPPTALPKPPETGAVAAPPPAPPSKKYPGDPHAANVPPEPGLYRFEQSGPPVTLDIKMVLSEKEGPGMGKLLMKKGKVVGYLVAPVSRNKLSEPTPIFYFRLPEGKGIEEIVLITLQRKNGRREIEMGPKQAFKAEATRAFDVLEVGPRLFKVTTSNLTPGEYLFFLLGSAEPPKGSLGKGYDFGIVAASKKPAGR